nr:TetR/AcrR family transcriptional regulator [uncultured Eisenbergiella sp.]
MDETSQKIIDAAMTLVRDQGYVATTTKDIARTAGVNECTLFRKFENKKDIVMQGITQEKWRANVTPEIFREVRWELRADLEMFLTAYMERITPDFVRLSIGLRAPQLYGDTAPLIMQIPQAFLASLTEYLEEMGKRGKIAPADFESMAMVIFSSTFGFTFLKASFDQKLTKLEQKEYIKKSVDLFIRGISV